MLPGLCFLAFYATGGTLALSLSVPQVLYAGQPCSGNWTRADSDPPSFSLQARQTDNQGGKSLFFPFPLPPITSNGKSKGTAFSFSSCPAVTGRWIIEAFNDPNPFLTPPDSKNDPDHPLASSNKFTISDSDSNDGEEPSKTDTPTSTASVTAGQAPTTNSTSKSTALTESSTSTQISAVGTPTASTSSGAITQAATAATASPIVPVLSTTSPLGPTSSAQSLSRVTKASRTLIIAGSVVGAIVLLALLAFCLIALRRRSRRKRETNKFYHDKMVRAALASSLRTSPSVIDISADEEQNDEQLLDHKEPLPSYGYSHYDIIEKRNSQAGPSPPQLPIPIPTIVTTPATPPRDDLTLPASSLPFAQVQMPTEPGHLLSPIAPLPVRSRNPLQGMDLRHEVSELKRLLDGMGGTQASVEGRIGLREVLTERVTLLEELLKAREAAILRQRQLATR
ncbi:hypothetical protein C8J56DRAFT_960577 [Mycena floridula]|nr:hypothetical protein C8J56DRAFT_960577 [Mycena floridula]